MNLIVAADENWAIGKDNKLLVSIPEDMKFFRTTTMGKVVVMGRKTLESFPGGRPLKGRINVVLTTREDYQAEGTVIVHSVRELLDETGKYSGEDVFVIGGGSVYEELLPFCTVAYVTRVRRAYEADAWFPNLDETGEWEVTGESGEQTYGDLKYTFVRYERKR